MRTYLCHNGVSGAVVDPAIQAWLGGPLGVIGKTAIGQVHETETLLRLPIRTQREHPGSHGGVGRWATVVGRGGGCEDL